MVDVANLQNRINTKIFDLVGSNLAASSLSTSSVDKWGDAVKTYTSIGTLSAVPWFHVKGRLDYQPFGDLVAGEVDMAFKHDVNIDIGYVVLLNNDYFEVKEIEKFPLKDGFLVVVARLAKYHS